MVFPAGVVEDRAAQGLPTVAADGEGNTGQRADAAVSGGINEGRRLKKHFFAALLYPPQAGDPVPVHGDIVDHGVQPKCQVGFPKYGVQQNFVPKNRIGIRIPVEVFQLQHTPDTHFLRPQVPGTCGSPGPYPYLAAGVSTEYRAVGDQDGGNA